MLDDRIGDWQKLDGDTVLKLQGRGGKTSFGVVDIIWGRIMTFFVLNSGRSDCVGKELHWIRPVTGCWESPVISTRHTLRVRTSRLTQSNVIADTCDHPLSNTVLIERNAPAYYHIFITVFNSIVVSVWVAHFIRFLYVHVFEVFSAKCNSVLCERNQKYPTMLDIDTEHLLFSTVFVITKYLIFSIKIVKIKNTPIIILS